MYFDPANMAGHIDVYLWPHTPRNRRSPSAVFIRNTTATRRHISHSIRVATVK